MSARFAVLALTLLPSLVAHADVPLGRVDFPVTGNADARAHFVRGVLALHSFWYEEARDEFRAAATAGAAMGFWGEALTYCHFVWGAENLAAERAALDKIPRDARLTARERGFIDAARTLVGAGDRKQRWAAYTDAMNRLRHAFPADDEAATFYAVALLGSPRDGRFRPFAEAGAIGLEVLARNPDHPGAAHYVIHAFDDPEHAIIALPAARRYAEIAPEAFHARHMPSHIFVQLGMWKEAQAANESSWAASVAAATKKHLDTSYADFHSLGWLVSIDLERGQPHRAREALERGYDALRRSADPDAMPLLVSGMAADYVLATNDWAELATLLAPLDVAESSTREALARSGTPSCPGHAQKRIADTALSAKALAASARADEAIAKKDAAALERARAALAPLVAKMDAEQQDGWQSTLLELGAYASELAGAPADAVASFRKAVVLSEREPPSGPAGAVTTREELAELLLRLHRPKEALVEFAHSLESHPLRSRSLLGAARAAKASGDARAKELYTQLAANWIDAEPTLPELAEVRANAAR